MHSRWRAVGEAGALLACAWGAAAQRAPTPDAPVAVMLQVSGRVSSVPSLAARGDVAVVAWAATAPGGRTDAFVAVSRDAGPSFAAPVRANDVAGTVRAATESGPRVALGPPLAGRAAPVIVLVWAGREPCA